MLVAASDWRTATAAPLHIRSLPPTGYLPAWRAMKRYNRLRTDTSADCIWLLQHPPTVTLGVRSVPSDVLQDTGCSVVRTDRGGQTTYHGPGQLVGYLMLDLRRAGMGVRSLVRATEQMLRQLLAQYGLAAESPPDSPGVYLQGRKIASLGFRISRHYSYHGFSLNVDCDLEPFDRIMTCGVAGQPMARLADYVPGIDIPTLLPRLYPLLHQCFGDGHGGAD